MATGLNLGMAAGTDVPVAHLDYGYIRECKDASEVEKLLQILRYARPPRSNTVCAHSCFVSISYITQAAVFLLSDYLACVPLPPISPPYNAIQVGERRNISGSGEVHGREAVPARPQQPPAGGGGKEEEASRPARG